MKKILILAFSILAGSILLSSGVAVKAAGGVLDPTFDLGYLDPVDTVVIQADGKILVGGISGLRRFNSNGSPDTTFKIITGNWRVFAIAVQSDGKIIISYFTNETGFPSDKIARLNTDGSLDKTFNQIGGEGPGSYGFNASVDAIAVQADDKILIGGGFRTYNGVSRNHIARLNRDGSLDNSFNPGIGIDGSGVDTITLQGDGKVIIGGAFVSYNDTARRNIARINMDGSLDSTFNPGAGANFDVLTTAIQSDGKIIIAGEFTRFDGADRTRIARLNSDGSLDNSFNPGTDLSAYINSYISKIVVQANDKILVGGLFDTPIVPSNFRNGIARLNSDGSIDTSFDPGTGADGVVDAIAVQRDGKIIIGGFFDTYDGIPRKHIARLLSDSLGGFSFSASSYNVDESDLRATITVYRLGDLSQAAAVDYATSDMAGLTPCNVVTGIASQRCDYQTTVGTLRFAPGEAIKTIYVPVVWDAYNEGAETFNITLSNPVGAPLDSTLSSATITIFDGFSITTNPIDDNTFFVRQLYTDFLSREPDPAGFAGWLNILNNCSASITQPCDRAEVALDFFRSPEFQDRGYFIYRIYRASLGRMPRYSEFIPDMAKVSGFLDTQDLEASKVAFIQGFINRPEFQARYGALSNSDYVNKLEATALVTLTNKQALIDDLQAGRKSRADVLRAVIETTEVYARYVNEAFIVMEYFGFLRRDPDTAFQNWVDIFNHTANYKLIISGFINSPEYRQRFGP